MINFLFFCFRRAYEQIALQSNNQNSETLARIHIEVANKIQLKVAKWALYESLNKKCVIQIDVPESKPKTQAVKRRGESNNSQSPSKESRMSQDNWHKDDAPPLEARNCGAIT